VGFLVHLAMLIQKSVLLVLILLTLNLGKPLAQGNAYHLQEGDLVFQDLKCGPLCDAIDSVTEGYQQRDFSHVGYILQRDSMWYALEAIGKDVHLTPLAEFMQRVPADRSLKMRPQQNLQPLVPAATRAGLKLLGKPYDDHFLMNNDSLYCSELIYEQFKEASHCIPLFNLQPMTYMIPDRHSIYPAWEEYFRDLKLSIPEGQPGINPGALSRSALLVEVK